MRNPLCDEVRDASGFKPIRIPWGLLYLAVLFALILFLALEAIDEQKAECPAVTLSETKRPLFHNEEAMSQDQKGGTRGVQCQRESERV